MKQLCIAQPPDSAGTWILRVVWPIENPELFDHEAIALAAADLPAVAHRAGAIVAGTPVFRIVDSRAEAWPHTATVVLCTAPAVPAVSRIVGAAPIERTEAA